MKNILPSLLSIVALAISLVSITTKDNQAPGPRGHVEDHFELGPPMRDLQVHAAKLWFAGKEANWPLVDFQLHEMEELMEEISEHEITEGAVRVDHLMKKVREVQVEALEEAAHAKDATAFEAGYDALVQNCNACHAAAGHPYVVIKRPTAGMYSNQDFKPRSVATP